jgi:hypothetical protein
MNKAANMKIRTIRIQAGQPFRLVIDIAPRPKPRRPKRKAAPKAKAARDPKPRKPRGRPRKAEIDYRDRRAASRSLMYSARNPLSRV